MNQEFSGFRHQQVDSEWDKRQLHAGFPWGSAGALGPAEVNLHLSPTCSSYHCLISIIELDETPSSTGLQGSANHR